MNLDYTHVSILLDKSGSMNDIKDDIVGGYNAFLQEQRQVPGKMTISLAQFNDQYEIIYTMADISRTPDMIRELYITRGSTALLDSMARMIRDTGSMLAAMSENDRPAKVLVAIITDGQENVSTQYNRKQVFEMVRHQESIYKWQFVFIGSDEAGIMDSQAIGVQAFKFNKTAAGTRSAFMAFSEANVKYRNTTVDNMAEETKFRMTQDDINLAEDSLKP